MNRFLTWFGLTAAVGMAGALPAWAQNSQPSGSEGFSIKLHAGGSAGSLKDDLHAQNLLGIGLEGAFALNSSSALIGELTFSAYGGGKGYDNTKLTGTVYASNGSSSVLGVPVVLAPGSSVDYRKNTLQGFSFRGGYRAKFMGDWAWQAGLTLDRMQYRQEASGTLQPRIGGAAFGNLEGFAVAPDRKSVV